LPHKPRFLGRLACKLLDQAAGAQDRRLNSLEHEQVGVAADDRVHSSFAGERDQVVVLRIARDGSNRLRVRTRLGTRRDAGDIALDLFDRQVAAELVAAQHAEQFGEEMWTDDERDRSLSDSAKDLGRRAKRSDDRRDEDAWVDDDAPHLRRRRVPLSAEVAQLGVSERERLVDIEGVVRVPRPHLINHLESEVATERVLDDS
jgi:hypothetical protein